MNVRSVRLRRSSLSGFISRANVPLSGVFRSVGAGLGGRRSNIVRARCFAVNIAGRRSSGCVVQEVAADRIMGGGTIDFRLGRRSSNARQLFSFTPILCSLVRSSGAVVISRVSEDVRTGLLGVFMRGIVKVPVLKRVVFSSRRSYLLSYSVFEGSRV